MTNQTTGEFTHLHVHTEYSILDGIANIPKLVAEAKQQGATALAITDHGVMNGAIDFYNECKENQIKPIIGCEAYVAAGSRHDRNPSDRNPKHLTLLCRDATGYTNLIQMMSKAHLEGFYQKPRVDRELLEMHSEGIYCLSGCMSGELASLVSYPGADLSEATETIEWYAATFPDRYFLEIQRHKNVKDLDSFNRNLIQLSEKFGIPLVATNDSHYVTADQHTHHDLYLALQTGSLLSDKDRMKMGDGSYYLKSPAEMNELFSDLPQALQNTTAIAEDCHLEFDFNQKRMPNFPTPDGQSTDQYLRELCQPAFEKLCPTNDPRYIERFEYELEVIRKTEFADYFLIVWDITQFTRQNDIKFGVRGSAAASLVLYCLGITDIDPMHYKLVFERFLNLERKEMPDIDIDFQDDRRDEALNYVVQRYGKDQVAQIITFGKYRPKSAIKAAGRAMQVPYNTTTDLSDLVPRKATSIKQAIEEQPEIQTMMDADQNVAELMQQAAGIEGVIHQTAPHPAGVVIAPEPIANIVPVQNATKGKSDLTLTQYSMDPIAKLGLVKMDFLGLATLTILDRVLKAVPEAPRILTDIPLNDKATYQLLGTGNTTNVFQLESTGMQRHIADLKPSSIGDISAMIALYRPGPMEHIERFIKSKHGKKKITYPHHSMKELLDETYGVIVYQDQVLQILKDFAGYTLGEADIVRKAMGKKIPELMHKERAAFLEGAAKQGYDTNTAAGIFDLIEPFAGYAFNKAHSISYALISYWTAYFKANHRTAYMTAVLNTRSDDAKDYTTTVLECRRSGISLLGPLINQSQPECTMESPNTIRLGLANISGVSQQTITPVLEEREKNGPYQSMADFCGRVPRQGISAKQIEALMKAGALDDLTERGHAVEKANLIWETINANSATRETGQISMFGNNVNDQQKAEELPWTIPDKKHKPATLQQKAEWETKTLGIALSWTPANIPNKNAHTSIEELPKGEKNWVAVAGFIETVTKKTTRDKKTFLSVSLNLADGPIEVVVWPSNLEKHDQTLWEPHTLVYIEGYLSEQSETLSLSAETISNLDSYDPKGMTSNQTLNVELRQTGNDDYDRYNFLRAMRIMVEYPGNDQVVMQLGSSPVEITTLKVDQRSTEMSERLKAIPELVT